MIDSTVIYGPPGCGKTTAIIDRMAEAVSRGTPASRIGLVSFTRAAAHEIAKRAGVSPGKNISTLHSYAFRLNGMIRDQVIDRAKLLEFSRVSKIQTTGASVYDEEQLGEGDYYLSAYGYMRSTMVDEIEAFKVCGSEGNLRSFRYFVKAYDQWKQAHGFMDFSDMLDGAMGQPPPDLDILFLDEAQDFSPAQWRLIESWVPHIGEMVLALDDDQTLYKFTGADPEGGPRFEQKYGSKRVVLDQSYRVPANIHALAERTIQRVKSRVSKEYLPVAPGGDINRYGSIHTLPVPDADVDTLILFRNHSLRGDIESWLIDKGVPYLTDNGRRGPLQGALAAAIRAWIIAQQNYEHTGMTMLDSRSQSLLRKMAKPIYSTKFRDDNLEQIIDKDWSQVLKAPLPMLAYFDRLKRHYGTPLPDTQVHLSTIHGAKGREAYRVVLLDAMSNRTAEAYTHDPDPEIRAFYVGITRTKQRLDVVAGENPMGVLR